MDFNRLETFLDNWVEEFAPGCQIVIYKDNKKVFRYMTLSLFERANSVSVGFVETENSDSKS